MADVAVPNVASDARAVLVEKLEKEAEATNKKRTGKGTRIRVGQTRGKNPQVIQWEAFDESQPDSLPATLNEFMAVTKVESEPTLVGMLIEGFNQQAYTAASDPIAEYVNPAWSDELQKQFRLVVRNYSNGTGNSLDDTVKLLKPGFDASHASAKK